jgi:cell division protein FtsQ
MKPSAAPRRKRRSAAARMRPFVMLIALGMAVAVVALTLAATWPGFDPREVLVSGNERVPKSEILARAAIAGDRSMWLQSPRSIARRIEAIPYVATASVHRLPPTVVMIVVRERVPFAVVRSGDDAAIVDRGLRVLQAASGQESLPMFALEPGLSFTPGDFVTQSDATTLRDDYDAMVAAHVVPQALALDRFGGLVATMRGGVRVLFGEPDELSRKFALVDPILAQVVHSQRRVAAIDLRAPATPVVVYR